MLGKGLDEGEDDGIPDWLGLLLGIEDGVSVWKGKEDGKEDGDCEGQLWKVNVRAYDPKISLLGAHFVTSSLISSDCVESSNKRNSPSNPAFGKIESYAAKLPVDLEELYLLTGFV
jgi:hypothetical protein